MKKIHIVLSGCLLFTNFNCKKDATITNAPPNQDSAFTILHPFWSHDGRKIIFLGHVFGLAGYDFYEVDPSGGIASFIMRDSLAKNMPVLSPDGTKIAYLAAELGRHLSQAHVWVMNVDGSNARDLTPFFSNWENLRWSPDSKTLIFDGAVEDSGVINYQIVSADVQSGQLRQLTRGNYGNRDASFLSDGRKIAYLSGRIRTEYGGKVWVMNADGSDPQPIDTTRTASAYPRPSPVRNELCFQWGLGLEGDAGIYSLNLDSISLPAPQGSLRFLGGNNTHSLGQWSPDGNSMLALRGYTSTTMDLVLLNHEGILSRRITNAFNVYDYAWSADSKRIVFSASDDQNSTTSFFVFDLRTNTTSKLVIKRN